MGSRVRGDRCVGLSRHARFCWPAAARYGNASMLALAGAIRNWRVLDLEWSIGVLGLGPETLSPESRVPSHKLRALMSLRPASIRLSSVRANTCHSRVRVIATPHVASQRNDGQRGADARNGFRRAFGRRLSPKPKPHRRTRSPPARKRRKRRRRRDGKKAARNGERSAAPGSRRHPCGPPARTAERIAGEPALRADVRRRHAIGKHTERNRRHVGRIGPVRTPQKNERYPWAALARDVGAIRKTGPNARSPHKT